MFGKLKKIKNFKIESLLSDRPVLKSSKETSLSQGSPCYFLRYYLINLFLEKGFSNHISEYHDKI